MKKITKATLKSFIKNNKELFINVTSSFCGMIDGCEQIKDGFLKAKRIEEKYINKTNMGIAGLCIVRNSGNTFYSYENDTYKGIGYSNCCDCGVIAVKK